MLMWMVRIESVHDGVGLSESMKRLPMITTRSVRSNNARPGRLVIASGWRSDSAPRPLSLITTGALMRSASRRSASIAFAATMPPPT